MKKPYLVGVLISMLAGVATVAIKSSITRYPGLGDFFLFYGVAERIFRTGIGEVVDVSGEVIVYGTKALFAVAVFSVSYFASMKLPKWRFQLSLAVMLVSSVAMSLGEAVVG